MILDTLNPGLKPGATDIPPLRGFATFGLAGFPVTKQGTER